MGIINLGQADNVIEEDGNGDIVANVDSINTGEMLIGADRPIKDESPETNATWLEEETATVSDGSFITLPSVFSDFMGLLVVSDETNQKSGIFRAASSSVESMSSDSHFTTAQGNSGTVNLYFDFGENRLGNQTGGEITVGWWVIAASK